MKEEIDWRKELFASKKFNDKFSRNLLENGVKNYMQEIYMGYMYSKFRKIKDKLTTIKTTKSIYHIGSFLPNSLKRKLHLSTTF